LQQQYQIFGQKILEIDGVIIVEFLVLKITISNAVSEKQKLYHYDCIGRFLLRFHHAISRTDQCVGLSRWLSWLNQFLNWFIVFSCAHRTLCLTALPPLHWACGLDFSYV